MEAQAAALWQVARSIGGTTAVVPRERKEFGNDEAWPHVPLTRSSAPVSLEAMNAQLLQSVAVSVKARSKGKMVHYNQKVQPDFQARLERAASRVGLTAADYLRVLVELHSEATE